MIGGADLPFTILRDFLGKMHSFKIRIDRTRVGKILSSQIYSHTYAHATAILGVTWIDGGMVRAGSNEVDVSVPYLSEPSAGIYKMSAFPARGVPDDRSPQCK